MPGEKAGARRRAREAALQALFQWEAAGHPVLAGLDWAAAEYGLAEDVLAFARELLNGVMAERRAIDDLIARYARDWDIQRLARVDRNILRIGIYELLFANRPDVPAAVAINEAVELAKRFSSAESGRFVNGVLGQLARDYGKTGDGDASSPPPGTALATDPAGH
ncbi:MAG TPA: transcription antitermination factor NusB [Thermaerobacter sp.]